METDITDDVYPLSFRVETNGRRDEMITQLQLIRIEEEEEEVGPILGLRLVKPMDFINQENVLGYSKLLLIYQLIISILAHHSMLFVCRYHIESTRHPDSRHNEVHVTCLLDMIWLDGEAIIFISSCFEKSLHAFLENSLQLSLLFLLLQPVEVAPPDGLHRPLLYAPFRGLLRSIQVCKTIDERLEIGLALTHRREAEGVEICFSLLQRTCLISRLLHPKRP